MNALEVVEAQLRAYNARDIDAFMACYSPEVVVEDAVGNVMMRGHAQMTADYVQFFDSNPGLHAEVVARLCIGDFVIDDEAIHGIQPQVVRAVVAYRVRSAVIDHVRIYKA